MCILDECLYVFLPGALWEFGPCSASELTKEVEPSVLSRDELLESVQCACCGPESSHITDCTSDGVLPSSGKMFLIKADGRIDVIGNGWGSQEHHVCC